MRPLNLDDEGGDAAEQKTEHPLDQCEVALDGRKFDLQVLAREQFGIFDGHGEKGCVRFFCAPYAETSRNSSPFSFSR